MKRLTLLVILAAVLGPPVLAQPTLYVSPDVPTDPGLSVDVLPWEVVRHKAGLYGPPIPEWALPGNPAIDALHKMDKPLNWLFSVETHNDLGGTLANPIDPRDVMRWDGTAGGYSTFFCGAAVTPPVPAGTDVDAVAIVGGDTGDLVVSFDVPTTLGGATYDPADLVGFTHTAPGCSGWTLTGPVFDASSAGAGVATAGNVTGADVASGVSILVFDVPTDLVPSIGSPTYLPGEVAAWDGVAFQRFDTLGSWPLSSETAALSCQANPGKVYEDVIYPFPIRLDKSTAVAGNIVISWAPSCSSGAEDYGIYEGTLGTWYSHSWLTCTDTGADLTEDVAPMAADSYYLVVPHNFKEEGSYGLDRDWNRIPLRIERPAVPGASCTPAQVLTPCPP